MFAYRDDAGVPHQVTISSSSTNRALEDEADEPLLYDPLGERDALPLDHVPGHPRIDPAGHWRPRRSPLSVALLPTLALLGLTVIAIAAR